MSEMIRGLPLSERFYWEAVRPILDDAFPGLAHSAGLIGPGSEVLGFDTERSKDHHFGPRLILFLPETDFPRQSAGVDAALRGRLPVRFLGFSTHFSPPDPNDSGVRHPVDIESGPVNHMIEITTISDYFREQLGVDPFCDFTPVDWLVFEEQRLLSLVRGGVFFDGLGQLEPLRRKLEFYPRDVWLYLLAAEWQKISQEEAFVGRTGEVDDDLGSRLVTARIVHTLMRLGFLMERQYPPYSKWFGTAFSRLSCAEEWTPAIRGCLAAASWPEREEHLCQAYTAAARSHNALNITPPVSTTPTFYFSRPFRVIHGDAIARQIHARILDPQVRRLPADLGSVNQFLATVEALDAVQLCQKLRVLFAAKSD